MSDSMRADKSQEMVPHSSPSGLSRVMAQSKSTWPLAFVIAVALTAMVFFDRPLVVGDGLAYLLWIDSVALDGDLDLDNQAARFAGVYTYHIYRNPHTGRWASAFPPGVAILLAPFYRLARWLDQLPTMRVNDAHFMGIQGVPLAYSLMIMVGINLYTLLMVGLGYGIARQFTFPWLAALTSLAVYLGTPLLFYSSVEPLNSHIGGAVPATLFIWMWLRYRRRPPAGTWREALPWLGIGLAGGLTALCRWQVALIAVPVGIELLVRRRWREATLAVLGGASLVWIIPCSWHRMYGKWILMPAAEGDKNIVVRAPTNWRPVLFSPVAGLFPWSPITALSLLGLIPLARRDRSLALSAFAMFAFQVLVNGAVRDWWAGTGFGMRRMAEIFGVYVLMLAALLQGVENHHFIRAAVTGAMSVLAAYGVALVLARMNFTWTNPWGLARDTPLRELRYTFSRQHWPLMWPVIKDHVGPWAWHKPGP